MTLIIKSRPAILLAIFFCISLLAACATAPKTESERVRLEENARQTLQVAQENDPSLKNLLSTSAGYAVFPKVSKGAIGVGGAYGRGVLFENGEIVGYCDLTQATIGFQLGGQTYAEIIAFETNQAVQEFKSNRFQFGAQATAVALKSGVGANAKYRNGVAVFTMDESGLMYEASVGGQKFDYQSK